MRLYRLLEGDTANCDPDIAHTWFVSQVCEEFGYGPRAALAEIEHCPRTLLLDILEFRAFARTKQAIETAGQRTDEGASAVLQRLYDMPMGGIIFDIEAGTLRPNDD